jgi:hypothetical protein
MFTYDFAAHDLMDMALQGGHLARDFLDSVKGQDTHFGVFQCNRVTTVLVVHDPVQSNDFARHLKARDLVAPVFGGQTGFEEAGPNGVQGSELFAVGEQGCASLDFAAYGHKIVQAIHVVIAQAHGHAQLAQVAIGAGDFDGLGIHGFNRS